MTRLSSMLASFTLAVIAFNMPYPSITCAKGENAAKTFYEKIINGLNGPKTNLSSWRGKVVIVNFWASWCGPCQHEIPRLKSWQRKYAPKGLQVVGIGLDVPTKLTNVARSLEIDYPLLVMSPDAARPHLSAFGNQEMMIPFTLVINREGTIAYRHKGLIGQDEFDIIVAPLL